MNNIIKIMFAVAVAIGFGAQAAQAQFMPPAEHEMYNDLFAPKQKTKKPTKKAPKVDFAPIYEELYAAQTSNERIEAFQKILVQRAQKRNDEISRDPEQVFNVDFDGEAWTALAKQEAEASNGRVSVNGALYQREIKFRNRLMKVIELMAKNPVLHTYSFEGEADLSEMRDESFEALVDFLTHTKKENAPTLDYHWNQNQTSITVFLGETMNPDRLAINPKKRSLRYVVGF